MNQAQTQGSVPRRVILLIVLGSLVPFVAVGVVLWTTLGGGADEREFIVVNDYLEAPTTVPERVVAVSEEVRRIQVNRSGVEVYDLGGQRVSIAANGTHLRRCGADPNVPARSFRVDEIDFARLPAILAAASERSGGAPNSATLEYIDDALTWRIQVWSEAGSNELLYGLDGELRPQSNAR